MSVKRALILLGVLVCLATSAFSDGVAQIPVDGAMPDASYFSVFAGQLKSKIRPKAIFSKDGVDCEKSKDLSDGCLRKPAPPLTSFPAVIGNGPKFRKMLGTTTDPSAIILPRIVCNAEPIGPRTFLTSAHCLHHKDFNQPKSDHPWINLGPVQTVTQFQSNKERNVHRSRPIQLCVLNEWIGKGRGLTQNDIGIVQVAQDIPGVNPLDLVVMQDNEYKDADSIMIGFMPSDRIKAEYLAEAVSATDVVTSRKQTLSKDGSVVCHHAGSIDGASGTALLTNDLKGIHCVNSKSYGEDKMCRTEPNKGNSCAPITREIKTALLQHMANPGSSDALTCVDLPIK